VRRFDPTSPQRLAVELAEVCTERHPGDHPLRVALDAPRCADLHSVLQRTSDQLEQSGHPVVVLDAQTFLRDASLRFEFGKTDVESFYSGWLDTGALQREVLTPLGPAGTGWYLPSLRDPVTNRSTRFERTTLGNRGVAIVVGEMLLGVGLTFDVSVHAAMSRQARRRRFEADWPSWAWTLPAFDRYDIDVDPSGLADVVIRYDDPQHPAIAIRPR
jgi:hypothetical protein